MKKFNTAHLFIARSRHCSVAGWALAALFVTSTSAFAQTTVWTAGTGNWFARANWSAGVPNSNTTADINNGGTAQITSSGAAASLVELGVGAQDTGTLSTAGSGNLDDGGALYVGRSGTGNLNITNGGVVSSSLSTIGENLGSNGTATVSDSGSWTITAGCFVGFDGNATLNITSGGQVSISNNTSIGENGTGAVTVDGVGSTLSVDTLFVIGTAGAGTLTISNGGHVVSSFGNTIGMNPGSNGLVSVSGNGSSWTNTGLLELSSTGGDGTLQIMSGGTVSNGSSFLGTFNGSGTVTVDGVGSTWTISGDLSVGGVFGGVGTVTISQSGQVTSINGLIADGLSSTGSVEVDGVGSTWTNSGNVYVGGDINGAVGTGELHLTNNGTVTASAVTIWGTGTVMGNGFVETTEVTNHGTVAPDQTIFIFGDLTFDSTAIMSSTVTSDTADSIMVQGTAGLNGDLNVTLTGGPFIVGTQYTLLLAKGGLNGTTFSNVSINAPPGVNAQVTYDIDHVYLVIESSGTPTPTPTPTPCTGRCEPTPRPRPTPAPRP
jgi:T5SS/PEP-CTERM-associated repeat protein